MNETVEIDLKELAKLLWKRAWVIILCVVIFASATFVYTKSFVEPLYTANVMIYVNNNSNRNNDTLSSSDLAVALRLVNTYINILKSDSVLEEVIDKTGVPLTASQIRSMLSAEAVDETEMFRISITSPNPQLSADVANAIADIAPEKIAEIIEGSSAKIIDSAKVPKKQSSPNYVKNTAIGGAVGIILAVAGIFVHMMLDMRIKREEDLASICQMPILGRIPNFNEAKKKFGKAGRR